jgi:hypothetical protein
VWIADKVLVAKGYRLVQRDQQFLMPESMRDCLPASNDPGNADLPTIGNTVRLNPSTTPKDVGYATRIPIVEVRYRPDPTEENAREATRRGDAGRGHSDPGATHGGQPPI